VCVQTARDPTGASPQPCTALLRPDAVRARHSSRPDMGLSTAQRGARRAALVPAGQRLAHHACPGRAAAQSLAQSTATASGSMRAAKDSGGSRGG